MASDSTKPVFTGGCHCGAIKYTLAIDSSKDLEVHRCNCTFCQKHGISIYRVADPTNDFRLVAGDRSTMGNYQAKSNTANNWFCPKCGVHVYAEGFWEYKGARIDFFDVNLNTIDQPQEGLDLAERVKYKYIDGLNDNFDAEMRDKPWPCGLV